MIDLTSDFGKRVEERLKQEQVLWLTTVSQSGTPQPNPVWFLWESGEILVYTQPASLKVRNLSFNPHVSLNLNSDAYGGNVIVITGQAQVATDLPPADRHPAYLEKYRAGIADLNMTPESFAKDFSVPLRITPTRLRGF
jgi:PPOX class probable F420-dependent enzyme